MVNKTEEKFTIIVDYRSKNVTITFDGIPTCHMLEETMIYYVKYFKNNHVYNKNKIYFMFPKEFYDINKHIIERSISSLIKSFPHEQFGIILENKNIIIYTVQLSNSINNFR